MGTPEPLNKNLFNIIEMPSDGSELSEALFQGEVLIERIVSTGQITPTDTWYDQPRDEWVALLQGNATILFGSGKEVHLVAGENLLIPAHQLHRVIYTSQNPPCIWLAIHGTLL